MASPGPSFSDPHVLHITVESFLDNATGERKLKFSDQDGRATHLSSYDPATEVSDEMELVWYLERHALEDPFSRRRAIAVEKSLRENGAALVDHVEAAVKHFVKEPLREHVPKLLDAYEEAMRSNEQAQRPQKLLQLVILGDTSAESIYRLHWEVLEDLSLWHIAWIRVIVSRRSPSAPTTDHILNPSCGPNLNILFVSARPDRGYDIPYQLMSKPIWQLIQTSARARARVKIHFARPATWAVFLKTLSKHEPGYFSIVNFDMHGVIKHQTLDFRLDFCMNYLLIERDRARLQFTPQNSWSSKPDSKPAITVAKELVKYGVKIAVLNACNSAKVTDMPGANLALSFTQEGVENVIAMSYMVMAETAQLFVREFYYQFLLQGQELVASAAFARQILRKTRHRIGRHSMDVEVHDAVVPVVYQSHNSSVYVKMDGDGLKLSSDISLPLLHSQDSQVTMEHASIIPNLIGRDADLLALETLLDESAILRVIGASGIGKSCFRRYLAAWWKESGYAKNVVEIDFLTEKHIWTESLVQELEPLCVKTNISAFDNFDTIFLIDNVEVGARSDESRTCVLPPHQAQHFRAFLTKLIHANAKSARCRLVLFSNNEIFLWSSEGEIRTHNLLKLNDLETSLLVRETVGPSHIEALDKTGRQRLEELCVYHQNNPLFIKTFIPLLKRSEGPLNPQLMLEDLRLGLPSQAMNHLSAQCENVFKVTSERLIDSSRHSGPIYQISYLLWSLTIVRDLMKNRSRLAYLLFLSLAPFQSGIRDILMHYFVKLHEKGVMRGTSVERKCKAKDLEEIGMYSNDELNSFNVANPHWKQEIGFVFEVLKNFGLLKLVKAKDTSFQTYWDLHPFLPYYIRMEILRNNQSDGQNLSETFMEMFWEYYELVSYNALWGGYPLEVTAHILQNNLSNICNAVKIGLKHPSFGSRTMYAAAALPQALHGIVDFNYQVAEGIRLCDEVIDQFEHILLDSSSSLTKLETLQQNNLQQVLSIIYVKTSKLGITSEISFETQRERFRRGVNLYQACAKRFNPSAGNYVYCFALECYAVQYSGDTDAERLETVQRLLRTEVPEAALKDAPLSSQMSLLFENAKFALATMCMFEKTLKIHGQLLPEAVQVLSEMSYANKLTTDPKMRQGHPSVELVRLFSDWAVKYQGDASGSNDIRLQILNETRSDPRMRQFTAIIQAYTSRDPDFSALWQGNNVEVELQNALDTAIASGNRGHQLTYTDLLFQRAIQRNDPPAAEQLHNFSDRIIDALTQDNAQDVLEWQIRSALQSGDLGTLLWEKNKGYSILQSGCSAHLDRAISVLRPQQHRYIAEFRKFLLNRASYSYAYEGRPWDSIPFFLEAAQLEYRERSSVTEDNTETGADEEVARGRYLMFLCYDWNNYMDGVRERMVSAVHIFTGWKELAVKRLLIVGAALVGRVNPYTEVPASVDRVFFEDAQRALLTPRKD